jgi:hypothetical protein
MSVLNGIIGDLREKRLWPLALALLVALVAVPVLLSNSGASQSTPPPAASSTPPPSAATELPAVSVSAAPQHAALGGASRDPFNQQAQPRESKAGSSNAKGTSAGGNGSSSTKKLSTTGPSKSGSSGSSTTTTTPTTATTPTTTTTPTTSTTPTTPSAPPETIRAGLTDTQSYDVALALTNSQGGFGRVDPLERLALLPSAQQPLLVNLGVLRGGHRELFVVQPGAVVSGAGVCTPGPIDCQILSLAPGEVESLSVFTTSGASQVALFSVISIRAHKEGSQAAARRARAAASTAGRALVARSTLSALALFRYEPGIGAIVDLRNLSVGER